MNREEYKRACWNLLSEFSAKHRKTGVWFTSEAEVERENRLIEYYGHAGRSCLIFQPYWKYAVPPLSVSALLADYIPADMLQSFLQTPYDIATDGVMWSAFQGKYVTWSEYWDEQEIHFGNTEQIPY